MLAETTAVIIHIISEKYFGILINLTIIMIGILTTDQINNVVSSQSVCRIACTDGKDPYICPVVYTFDGKHIIFQSKPGKKINYLRKNSSVCAEIDIINNLNNWKSVLVYGTFEELKNKEADEARKFLFNKAHTLMTISAVHPFEHSNTLPSLDDPNRIKKIMCRINIKEMTGRYEM